MATRLKAADFRVHADITRAETLPPAAFTDPAFLALELDTVFRRSWLPLPVGAAGPAGGDDRSAAEVVRRRGARTPVSLLGRPLFLQRDWEDVLRCFPNVCTHAWHTLVAGPGRDRAIVCPQHGRRFDTRGRYVSQPGFDDAGAGFPRACDSLQAVAVHEWDELLFACLGRPAAPARTVLGPVQASLGRLPFGKLRWRPSSGEVRDLAGNWKQHAWNYLDAMHIPYIHSRPGGLAEAIDLASYRTELFGHAALQWAYARDPAHGLDPRLVPGRFRDGDRAVFALWWFVFPNLTLNFYPWGLSVNAYMPSPDDPQRTAFHWHHLVWDNAAYARRDDVWMLKAVDDEDVDALTQVARGVRSGLAPRGRFAPGAEAGPHWFHRRVYESVFGPDPRRRRARRRTKT